MTDVRRPPRFIWHITRLLNRRVASLIRSGRGPADLVLVLTTTGRKSGQPRDTPLQYEDVDGTIYVGSARGTEADWFRNIVADPHVSVQTKDGQFTALAEPITDPDRIVDFLELRLQRHPRMIRAMLKLHGLPLRPHRTQLEPLATHLALVALHSGEPIPERKK